MHTSWEQKLHDTHAVVQPDTYTPVTRQKLPTTPIGRAFNILLGRQQRCKNTLSCVVQNAFYFQVTKTDSSADIQFTGKTSFCQPQQQHALHAFQFCRSSILPPATKERSLCIPVSHAQQSPARYNTPSHRLAGIMVYQAAALRQC